jgi:ABC-type branched-chain amino acid transport systems, ATPase component
VFLVEQNAFHALKLAHRGYVMVNGLVTMSGSGRELLETPRCVPRISRVVPTSSRENHNAGHPL